MIQANGKQTAISSLRGDIAGFGLSAILTLMEMEAKTGEMIAWKPGETARLLVRGGRIVDAALARKEGEVRGTTAVFHVLTWNEGRFRFSSRDIETDDGIGESTTRLLMESARRLDESRPA